MTKEQTFDETFRTLTGDSGYDPHDWQSALGTPSSVENRLIRIPTGMGKTLGVLSAWLHHRVQVGSVEWPTRLVWCLPMRTLVEQTEHEALTAVEKLGKADEVDVHTLMGGVEEHRWYGQPEKPAILIGTQDMLLSRALNRGYALYRAAWPRAYGLLNSDALWVMDEVQLMGVGLTTSGQLQAYARSERAEKVNSSKPRFTWWMSATLQPNWLETSETQPLIPKLESGLLTVQGEGRIGPQWDATKPIELLPSKPDDWAELVISKHESHTPDSKTGRQTLVVVNTVKQATSLYSAIAKKLKGNVEPPQTMLIHSRFRPAEREAWRDAFLSRNSLAPETNRILIATQVVEAGVDISSSCLVTELAPWPSLVQRFGRAARYGGTAEIVVLDQQHVDDKKALPYSLKELNSAREAIARVDDVSIGKLEDFESELSKDELSDLYPHDPLHVLLPHEIDELFDTSADLSGADMDVSRFIRDAEESRDVRVFWRSWDSEHPDSGVQPSRRELCTVPIGDAKKWIKGAPKSAIYAWDYVVGEWVAADSNSLSPGMMILAAATVGGYSEELGFTGAKPKKNSLVRDVSIGDLIDTAVLGDSQDASDAPSKVEVWKTIATHCREATSVGDEISQSVKLDAGLARIVSLALRLHDWGKAHPSFANGTYLVQPLRSDLAKAPFWRAKPRLYDTVTHGPRRGFRHELASCLAVLELLRGVNPTHEAILGNQQEMLSACGFVPFLDKSEWTDNAIAQELNQLSEPEFNLLLFLIASHHGKVRASLQASPKDQEFPIDGQFSGDGYPIRGVRDGDELPEVALPLEAGEQVMPTVWLSLAPASLGLSERYGFSWAQRVQALMDHYGAFTLGYLEAIVRAADGRASDERRSPGHDPDPLLTGVELTGGSIAGVILNENVGPVCEEQV